VRARFTVLDALENVPRLDSEFLRELVVRHKSGLDILAGSEEFDRPNGQDAGAIEELMRVLGRIYDFVIVDIGTLSACTVSTLYAADSVFLVVNPDVPSIRNAQRLVHRVNQVGAGSDRVRILLNRVSEQHLIAPKQIETALGHAIDHSFSSDYGTVSSALNAGVPLTLSNHSALASQFGRFTRQILGEPDTAETPEAGRRSHFLGLF
jgi:pilus assembly protein CpaE